MILFHTIYMINKKDLENIKESILKINANVSFFNNYLNKQFNLDNNKVKRLLKHFLIKNKDVSFDFKDYINYNNIYSNNNLIVVEKCYNIEFYNKNYNLFLNFIEDLNKLLNQKEIYVNFYTFNNTIIKTLLLKNNEWRVV